MKNSQDLQDFIRSIQGFSSQYFVVICAEKIESIKDLDLRRQLAEHVLYHVAKARIAPSDPNFMKISESIESSAGDKLSKKFKSLIGSKAKVDDPEKSIQKLFREYAPDKYDLAMLAARAVRYTGITAEPVSSSAATSGGAGAEVVAKAEDDIKKIDKVSWSPQTSRQVEKTFQAAADDLPKTTQANVSESLSTAEASSAATVDLAEVPKPPTAVAGAPRPNVVGTPPKPPTAVAGAPRPNVVGTPPKPPTAAGMPRPPMSGAVPRPPVPKPPLAASSEEKDAATVDSLQEQISKLRKSAVESKVKAEVKPSNPRFDELQKRLKGRGMDTSAYETVATAPEKEAPPPAAPPRARKKTSEVSAAAAAPPTVAPQPKVSFFEQARGVQLRSRAKEEKELPPTHPVASSELEEKLRRRRAQEDKADESTEVKKGPGGK